MASEISIKAPREIRKVDISTLQLLASLGAKSRSWNHTESQEESSFELDYNTCLPLLDHTDEDTLRKRDKKAAIKVLKHHGENFREQF